MEPCSAVRLIDDVDARGRPVRDAKGRRAWITVVFAGLGAFAGIFGMSEAGAAFARAEAPGFWLVTAAIVALSLTILAVLRRLDWI
jgi:hypothetical protein